jgi:hypothetical protein
MTNDALIRIFFMGVATGKEESYGLSIKPSIVGTTMSPKGYIVKIMRGDLALFSKTSHFPLARKLSENYFVISTPCSGIHSANWRNHLSLATTIAKQIGVGLLASPKTDVARFQRYMESKINGDLDVLARTTNSSFNSLTLNSKLILSKRYQDLVTDIHTLFEGEILLKLPRYQVNLLDTEEARVVWAWLIKENPIKEDRELFMKIYTLSRLFSAQQKDEEVDLGTVDISSL